jgi:septal ring factor EnvC (AmiA/AmiB activator)
MTRGIRTAVLVLLSLLLMASLFVTGCTRYANEEQLNQLDETNSAAVEAEAKVAELEAEKAALEAKLAEKQKELDAVKAEKERIAAELAK